MRGETVRDPDKPVELIPTAPDGALIPATPPAALHVRNAAQTVAFSLLIAATAVPLDKFVIHDHATWTTAALGAGVLAGAMTASERWPGRRRRDRWKHAGIGALAMAPVWAFVHFALPRHFHDSPLGAAIAVAAELIAVIGIAVIGRSSRPDAGTGDSRSHTQAPGV